MPSGSRDALASNEMAVPVGAVVADSVKLATGGWSATIESANIPLLPV